MRPSRLIIEAGAFVAVMAATLVLVDVLCNLLGLLPLTYEYGDLEVGWLAVQRTETMRYDSCEQLSTGQKLQFLRNEDGLRTSLSVQQLLADHASFKIAVTGDSQTDLCVANEDLHSTILERELSAQGVKASVLPYGVPRYSPLQSYLVYKKLLKKYSPDALVLNFYTGNDFHDLLRLDDRPHFVKRNGRYEIAKPVWYRLDDPGVQQRSRTLFLFRSLMKRVGLRNLLLRVRFLLAVAADQGKGPRAVVGYMRDLQRSIEPTLVYHEAFAAQILNQQLFFHWFPESRRESIERVRALMEMARRENPHTLLILSALPSYELVQEQPVDAALLRTLGRLSITYEGGLREEGELYETLRHLTEEHGWLFVDNLSMLRKYRGRQRLYNDADYHLLPAASHLIGRAQAAVVLGYLRSHARRRDPRPVRSEDTFTLIGANNLR